MGSLLLVGGCATAPMVPAVPPGQAIPTLQGSYHQVLPGETLWRIAHSYGLDTRRLAAANHLSSASHLKVGQQLFIPLPPETRGFVWPVRGELRGLGNAKGIEIRAVRGSLVRASRTGRVAVATQQLSGWGKTVVIDHLDGFVSVYAGLEQILVAPGTQLRQGMPIGTLGARELHFEIRDGVTPKNTLALLPSP